MCEMKVFVDMIVNIIIVMAARWPGAWYKHNDTMNDNLYGATPVAGQASVPPLLSHLTFSLVFLSCHFGPE